MIDSPPQSFAISPAPPTGDVPYAEPILDALPVDTQPVAKVGLIRQAGNFVYSVFDWFFGVASLMFGLAILAAVPVVQLLTFGYLLEVGGRVARTGRLRDGFIGVRPAARLGSIVLGSYLTLLPLWFVSAHAHSAQLIDPDGPVARQWRIGLTVMTVVLVIHIVGAVSRGGRLRWFFWPFNWVWLVRRLWRGGYYTEARDAVWDFVTALRLPYYFWLGLRGFAGAFLWLAVPVSLIALGRVFAPLGFVGALLLAVVALYLPFLQIHFASEDRFRALFEVGAVRRMYTRAPVAFAFWLLATLAFALPLYLLKIELIPRDAAWLPSLVFITFIFPARLMTGWACGRAIHRDTPRYFLFRWAGRPIMFATAAFYVLIVFFTQFTSWNGIWSLYEQHAFLLPVPFVSGQ